MSWLYSQAHGKVKSRLTEIPWKPRIAASASIKGQYLISTRDQREAPIILHVNHASEKWPKIGIKGIERPQKKSIESGEKKTLKASNVIEKRIGKSITAKKLCVNTGLMSIGSTNKCSSKAGCAGAASKSSSGETNKNLPMLIIATKQARFAEFCAIVATRFLGCVGMTQNFFQAFRSI